MFQIDQQTKKRWLSSSTASIRVAYYHDPNRKTYRIIAIENSKVYSNSIDGLGRCESCELRMICYCGYGMDCCVRLARPFGC